MPRLWRKTAYLEVEPHLLLGPVGGISPRVPAQRPQGHRYFFSEVFLQGQEVGGIEGGAGHLETAGGLSSQGEPICHWATRHLRSWWFLTPARCFTRTPGFPFTEGHRDPVPESRLPGEPVLKAGLPAWLAPADRERQASPHEGGVHTACRRRVSDSREALLMPSPSGTPCSVLPTRRRTTASWCCLCHKPLTTFIILWSLF